MKCDICDKELTKEQLKWEAKQSIDIPCYCNQWREIRRLRNKIKKLNNEKKNWIGYP